MLVTILLFIAILGTLILVHEFGHFIMAKRAKTRVEEFGIGFPPRIFGIKRGETIYSINLFPIGGFVKIFGEDGENRRNTKSFASKSIFVRSVIIAAGVMMNILLAVMLLTFGHIIGMPQVLEEDSENAQARDIVVRIADVSVNSPAKEAGFQAGDIIYTIGSGGEEISAVKHIADIQDFTLRHSGEIITFSLNRGSEIVKTQVIARNNPPYGQGPIGFSMLRTGQIAYPFYLAPFKGIESTALLALATLKSFGVIITEFVNTGELLGDLAGPVGIAVITGQVQKMGFVFLLQFIALISINLAIINVLPFPALDGGRLLFLLIERVKGSPVKQKYEKIAHATGFAILMVLMILVTVRDIGKFF